MINNILIELSSNYSFFLQLLIEHIEIIFLAIIIAVIFGLSIGIWISEKPKLASYIISIVNILYTIPSIALLGFLISFTGIGNTTAIIALTLYGLLPIVRSTYIGITTIDSKIIEASEAMGSKKNQILYKIKLPLAFPIIFSAIRNMVTMTIALAGIASFVGAGGLGVAIYRGITTNNHILIIIGSLLIALLALVVDGILGVIGKLIMEHKLKKIKFSYTFIIIAIAIIFIALVSAFGNNKKSTIEIASKPTSEEYILAEMLGELIKEDTGLKVNITHGVGGGTSNIHPAMLKGEFQIYPEYTGTGWQIVLKHKEPYTNKDFSKLKKEYEDKYGLSWRGMLGFNNTYSLGIRKDLADKYNIRSISDLVKYARHFTFGAEYDFFEREDGYKALTKAYKLHFKKAVDMDNGLKYQALFDKKVDVMTVFTTDGQLSDKRIVLLKDDKGFYPKYMAGYVVNSKLLKKYPSLENTFAKLDNILNEKTMSELNRDVEVKKESPKEVALKFLKERGILGKEDGENN